jgi:NSS family neurotransmitter:Na+ symporter
MLVTLGIDSAFSLVEAVSSGITDYTRLSRGTLNAIICVAAFAVGLLFMTNAGLYWLDIIDHYINNFLILFIGLCEAVVIGYIYGAPKMRDFVNRFSDWKVGRWWDLCIWIVLPLFLGTAIVLNTVDGIANPYGDGSYPFFANLVGWAVVVGLPVLSILVSYALRNHGGVTVEEKASD